MSQEPTRCVCQSPTSSCSLYGYMKGQKYEVCNSKSSTTRSRLLESFKRINAMEKGEQPTEAAVFQERGCCG